MINKKQYFEAEINVLLESITDAVLVGNEEKILRCNTLAKKIFKSNDNYEVNQMFTSLESESNVYDAVTNSIIHFSDLPYQQALQGIAGKRDIYFNIKPFNQDRYFHCYSAPIILNNNSIAGAVLIFSEYTYEKLANEKIKEAINKYDEIKTLNKQLEQYSYAIAHDLKSPINSITALTHVILEEYRDVNTPEVNSFIEKIHQSSLRVGQYVLTLLKLSQIGKDSFNKEWINLDEILNQLIEEQKIVIPNFKHNITFEKGMNVFADRNLIQGVFQNLLINAIKFSSYATEPTVTIGQFVNENNRNIIFVKDNGVGFDDEQANAIFIPKAKKVLSGTFDGHGIGLATTQHIINTHDGKIWATGKKGMGATFFLYLPEE
jgi:signal transduction histidine kinase